MFISELKIDNFRSLKNVHLRNMQRVCIFHGDNNSGKSNILAAIEAILKGKTVVEAPGTEKEPPLYRNVSFNQGQLRGFEDNFRFNEKQAITFSLSVTLDETELSPYRAVIEGMQSSVDIPKKARGKTPKQIRGLMLNDGHVKTMRIDGELTYVDDSTCEAITRRIDINNNFILFALVDDKPVYVPSLEKSAISLDERERTVAGLTRLLTDGFRVIGTNRALDREKLNIAQPPENVFLPSTFKRSLFRLATDRQSYDLFKQISRQFNSNPFSFGEISFAIDPRTEEVEVMIEKGNTRLPLNRIGSGLQQILFLIANIVYNSHKMIGFEEIELNLSPEAQKRIFETLKSLIYDSKLINQALVTSHSPYFRNRKDVGYFEVSYDNAQLMTIVKPITKTAEKEFFFASGWPKP